MVETDDEGLALGGRGKSLKGVIIIALRGGELPLGEMLTVAQVAAHYQKSERQVRYALQTGKLVGKKFGWIILIDKDALPEHWPGDSGEER